ncbi:MAG TPA: hypothetical protein VJ160_05610 [Anaerolineales bacterium]|nr:hypothetical protein [Anaerolineales bacterium]
MHFQDATADTLNYMILGYAVILGAMALYVLSLWIRTRNARRDLTALGELESSPRA